MDATIQVKKKKELIKLKMHIDGIEEISNVDNFNVVLKKKN